MKYYLFIPLFFLFSHILAQETSNIKILVGSLYSCLDNNRIDSTIEVFAKMEQKYYVKFIFSKDSIYQDLPFQAFAKQAPGGISYSLEIENCDDVVHCVTKERIYSSEKNTFIYDYPKNYRIKNISKLESELVHYLKIVKKKEIIDFSLFVDTLTVNTLKLTQSISNLRNLAPSDDQKDEYNYYLGIHYYRLACYSNFKERNEFLDSCLFFIQRMDVSFKPEEKKKYAQLYSQYRLFSTRYNKEAIEKWWLNTYEKNPLEAKSLKSALDADGLQGEGLYNKIYASFQLGAILLKIKKDCDLSFLNHYLSQCTREVTIETNCTLSEILAQSNLSGEFKSGVVYNLYVKKKDCQLPDHLQFLRVFEK